MGWSEHRFADSFLVEEHFIIGHRQTSVKWNVGKKKPVFRLRNSEAVTFCMFEEYFESNHCTCARMWERLHPRFNCIFWINGWKWLLCRQMYPRSPQVWRVALAHYNLLLWWCLAFSLDLHNVTLKMSSQLLKFSSDWFKGLGTR